jgi:vacuolar-type H+-ATPase subunit E/Vma4
MEENEQDKQRLIEQIQSEAKAEAERIRKEGTDAIASLKQSHADQVERITKEEARRADEQIAGLEKRAKVAEAVAERRRDLAVRTQIIKEVNRRVVERFDEVRKTEAYRDSLADWIVEGMLGLESDELVVEYAHSEVDLVRSLVPVAVERAAELSGRTIKLTLADGPHRGSGGVIIRDQDGSRVYDNRIETRIVRYRNEIQRMIHERLFTT